MGGYIFYNSAVFCPRRRDLLGDSWGGAVHRQGLSSRVTGTETHDARRERIHPALSAPCPPHGLSPHPLLRLPRCSPSPREAGPLPTKTGYLMMRTSTERRPASSFLDSTRSQRSCASALITSPVNSSTLAIRPPLRAWHPGDLLSRSRAAPTTEKRSGLEPSRVHITPAFSVPAQPLPLRQKAPCSCVPREGWGRLKRRSTACVLQ
jgi:hypothetical protein